MSVEAERLREIMHYDPATGLFTFRTDRGTKRQGAVAGCVTSLGYTQISVDNKLYYAHRLAFLYMLGEWPPEDVDHINMNKSDNRWENLRLATRSQNMANTKRRARKKGVSWNEKAKKWQATICVDYTRIYLGVFAELDDAAAAYVEAAKKYHGEYSRS